MKIELEKISEHVGNTGDFITLNEEKCNGCGRCAIVCVMNLWLLRAGKAHLKKEYREKCLECGACYAVCDIGAIEFSYPAGGTGVVFLKG
ncbi:MAG: ATP-binding protein [Candidatus Helarchaeota archaeon]